MNRHTIYGYSNKEILVELSKFIKRKRLNLGLQQSELAERCGISLSTIHAIENGHNATLDTFIAVLRELREFDTLYLSFLKPEPIAPDILLKITKNQRMRVKKIQT